MSKLSGKFCSVAHMHDNAFFPGPGEIKKELVVGNAGNNQVKSIEIEDELVIVTFYSVQKLKTYTIVVPTTNFRFLVIDESLSLAKPLRVTE
jgi:hypothetical protein